MAGDLSLPRKRHRPAWHWALAALLAALVWLLLSPLPLGLPPAVRAVLLAPVLFLLPGYLLQRAAFAKEPWPALARLPLAFALSVGVGALAWGLAQLLGGSLAVMAYLLAGAGTALLLWNVFLERRGEPGCPATPPGRQPWWPYLLLLLPILFWTFVAACWGAPSTAEGDDWYYLAITRRIAQTQALAPGDPFFAGAPDPQRGGTWVGLLALQARLSGVDAATIWAIGPAVLLPVAILAHFLLGLTLFQERLAAALSCLFLLYGFGRATWDIPLAVILPAGVGFILFLVALALAWRYAQDKSRPALVLAILTAWALASIHLLVFGGLLLALASFAVAYLIVHRQWGHLGRLLLLIVIPTLLALPFVRGWTGSAPQTSNPIYADEWGLLGEFRGWHILKPSVLVGSGSSPWAWSFLLTPLLVVLARRRNWALFLLATMLFVIGTAFNPLVVEPLLRSRLIPPWGIWRLELQVFQFQFVLGGLGALAIRWLERKIQEVWGGPRLARAALLLAAVGLGFLPSAVPLVKPLWGYATQSIDALRDRTARFPFNWTATLSFLNDGLPAGSVVLADTNTSYFIPALTDQYVVSIPYGHSSPFVNDDEQRRQDNARALDPATPLDQVLGVLDHYQVGAVVLTLAAPPVGQASLSAEAYATLVARFENAPAYFQRIFSDEADPARRTTIFRYTPPGR